MCFLQLPIFFVNVFCVSDNKKKQIMKTSKYILNSMLVCYQFTYIIASRIIVHNNFSSLCARRKRDSLPYHTYGIFGKTV